MLAFRITVGLKIFQAFLAADLGLSQRTTKEENLEVLVVQKKTNNEMISRLNALGPVHGLTIRAVDVAPADLKARTNQTPCRIFIGSPLLNELNLVIAFANQHKIPIFSPFAGDVAQGAAAGILVTDRIAPLVNPTTLQENGIMLKPFFLKTAAQHE